MPVFQERDIDNLLDDQEGENRGETQQYLGDREALFDKFFNQSEVEKQQTQNLAQSLDRINFDKQSKLTFMILNIGFMTEEEMLKFDFRQDIYTNDVVFQSSRKYARNAGNFALN